MPHCRVVPADGRLCPFAELRIAPALVDDPFVLRALVLTLDLGQLGLVISQRSREPIIELVGQREQQRHNGLLVFRIDDQNVAADAFGLERFVEQPVARGFFQRGGNSGWGDQLWFNHGRLTWRIVLETVFVGDQKRRFSIPYFLPLNYNLYKLFDINMLQKTCRI